MSLSIVSPDSTQNDSRRASTSVASSARISEAPPIIAAKSQLSMAAETPPSTIAIRYSSQLNEQLTIAQRARDFVDALARDLEALKTELSYQLTQRRIDHAGLAAHVSALAEQWDQRYVQSGGSIDSQLHFCLAGDARQSFTIRGLDLASLTTGSPETLVFFTGAQGAAGTLTVNVGNGVNEETVLRAFRRAFAPAGVGVDANDNGALNFAVHESQWPGLRDRLMVRGGGIRFPSGQAQRVRADAEPDLFSFNTWHVNEHSEVRQTLQRVVRAQAQLQQVRTTITNVINEAQRSIEQLSKTDEYSWAGSFAADFNARFNQASSYHALRGIVPAVMGMSRYRVLSLLSLVG